MTDQAAKNDVAYHLLLDPPEAAIAVRALHLLIADEAHEPDIRAYARAAIAAIESSPGSSDPSGKQGGGDQAGEGSGAPSAATGAAAVPLTAPQMKIVHTAVRLLLLDTQRDQEAERRLLHGILEKLPDEHSLRAIEL